MYHVHEAQDTSFVVIRANLPAGEACDLLADGEVSHLVVHRAGETARYYLLTTDEALPALRAADPGATVAAALQLDARQPDPVVKLHPDTAAGLGIGEGDRVYVETPRGRIEQTARLVDWIDPRVVDVDYAWWFPEAADKELLGWDVANLNILLDNKPPFCREMGSPAMRGVFCRVVKRESDGLSQS